MNKELNDDGTPNPNYNPDLNEDGSPKTKGQTAEELAEEEAKRQGHKSASEKDKDMIEKIVAERVAAELSETKKKLDAAYKARDDVLAKNIEFEKKEKEAQYKLMEEEGKIKEVYEMKLAEQKAQLDAEKRKNTELSRDNIVRATLNSYSFRNTAATELAYKEVITNLVQNEQGSWIHRSGISIPDYVEAFSKSEEMSFLFKPKTSSGAGTTEARKQTSIEDNSQKSLFKIPQDQVLKLAAEGKLPGQKPNFT